jgi:hypothetical protein
LAGVRASRSPRDQTPWLSGTSIDDAGEQGDERRMAAHAAKWAAIGTMAQGASGVAPGSS